MGDQSLNTAIQMYSEAPRNRTHVFVKRKLPHLISEDAIYFVTWRLARGQNCLSSAERDVVDCSIKHFDQERYRLISYVVMDDHVHCILQPLNNLPLYGIIQGWKSFTSHTLVKSSGRLAPIWQADYFDRRVRNAIDLAEKAYYIACNPTKRWPEMSDYKWHYAQLDGYL
jgi:REP element-mobilizing transposase RayT